MKKQYQKPEVEIIELITEVIATEDEDIEGPTTSLGNGENIWGWED